MSFLARRKLPARYAEWNKTWHAPFGRTVPIGQRWRRLRNLRPGLFGPFSIQKNNTTRHFEYPWAFFAVPIQPGRLAIELGGGLSGFQFVLAACGARVRNVDPGEQAEGRGWPVDQSSIARLNRAFGTRVELAQSKLDEARLQEGSVQTIYCISTLDTSPALPGRASHAKSVVSFNPVVTAS